MLHYRQFERQSAHVSDEAIRRENRDDNRSKVNTDNQQQDDNSRLQPSQAWGRECGFDRDSAGGQQHGINRSEIVIFPVQQENYCVADDIAVAEETVRPHAGPDKKCTQTRDPNRRGQWIQQQCLLQKELAGRQPDVAAICLDVSHQLQEWSLVMNVPQQIRQKNQECSQASKPNPFTGKYTPVLSEQQANHDCEPE